MATATAELLDLKDAGDCEGSDEVCMKDEPQEGNATASNANDAYSYTKRDEFTSEIFKIEIGNLPRIYSVNVGREIRVFYVMFNIVIVVNCL